MTTASGAALERLFALPRLGWIDEPTPVTPAVVAGRAVYIKRDDLGATLHGSTKVRKLDALLAASPWADASRWASAGAIGSGHLTALTAAANVTPRAVDAYMFWEPVSRGVLDNLAHTATHAAAVRYAGSRVSLALRHPAVLAANSADGACVIPPGGTTAVSTLGVALGAVELAAQVEAGVLPRPSRVYVALGSGGTAAGLALGFGLAGLNTEIHAVAVVERMFSPVARLRWLIADALRMLGASAPPRREAAVRLRVRRGFVGPAYGVASAASIRAADELQALGVPGEDVYTGKAFACWLSDAPRLDDGSVFWFTGRAGDRGPAGASSTDQWRERVPAALLDRLARDPSGALAVRRRRLFALGGAPAAAAFVGARHVGYDGSAWSGSVLSAREAQVVAAAAAALVPGTPGDAPPEGTWLDVAANVDAFLVGMPPRALREVRALLWSAEQFVPLLGRSAARLTRADAATARVALETLATSHPLAWPAYAGLRDLCMVGAWQQPARWAGIGYDGPLVPAPGAAASTGRDRRPRPPSRYDHLLAPPGPPSDAT